MLQCKRFYARRLLKDAPLRNYSLTLNLKRHFLFTSSDTFTVRCVVQPQHTAKNQTDEISACAIEMGSVVTWLRLFQTRHFRRFGSAAIVRRTQYDRPSERQLLFFVLFPTNSINQSILRFNVA